MEPATLLCSCCRSFLLLPEMLRSSSSISAPLFLFVYSPLSPGSTLISFCPEHQSVSGRPARHLSPFPLAAPPSALPSAAPSSSSSSSVFFPALRFCPFSHFLGNFLTFEAHSSHLGRNDVTRVCVHKTLLIIKPLKIISFWVKLL